MKGQTIREFFEGRSVFITGATGFMGKVLVEKLLRSCSNLNCLYILIRKKRDKAPKERLIEMTQVPLFDLVREKFPGIIEEKLIPIEGDISEERLGISNDDYQLLMDNVSIIFHMAASVNFRDPLPVAVQMNVKSTISVVELGLQCKKIAAFVHLSTAFSNCLNKETFEVMYPPHANWRQTVKIVDGVDPAILSIFTDKYIGRMPNTYSFTKQLAEHVVWDHRHSLPVTIIRPSIVTSTWTEPIIGWTDTFNGINGLFVGCGKGVIRVHLLNAKAHADFIPVDVVIRGMILSAWKRGHSMLESEDSYIFNTTMYESRITNDEMMDVGFKAIREMPLDETVWTPARTSTKSPTWFTVQFWFKHVIPAMLVDAILRLQKRRPKLLAIQRKVYVATLALGKFTVKDWRFCNYNFLKLNENIPEDERKDFDHHMGSFDAVTYFKLMIPGGKRYLIKDKMDKESVEAARKRANKLYWIDRVFSGGMWALFSVFAYWIFV